MSSRLTRRALLTQGMGITAAGAAGAASVASAASAAGVAGAADAASSEATPAAEALGLQRLLSVELLLLFCYQHVLASSVLTPRTERMVRPLSSHEQAHVRALRLRLAALGGAPPQPPTSVVKANHDLAHRKVPERLGQLRGGPDALRLLLAVERVTVGVYFVALTKLQDPGLIRLVAEIMANDAQHEAILGEALHPGNAQMAVPYGLVQGVQ